jgi:hypothetical protein
MIILEQWICDKCGGLIKSPENGWFEWLTGDSNGQKVGAHGFKIVHDSPSSPRGLKGCYHYEDELDRADNHLSYFVGAEGMVRLLAKLDVGPIIDPQRISRIPGVRDIREFAEYFRRLMLPHYEEARTYFEAANSDGFFEGMNEYRVYQQETLQMIIEKYGRA